MVQKDTAEASEPKFGAFRRKPPVPASTGDAGAAAKPAAMPTEIPTEAPDDLIEIGTVGDAYGVKGWVKIFAHAGPGKGGDALLDAGIWWLEGRTPGVKQARTVLQSRRHVATVVGQLDGVADRDAALALRGQRVFVPRTAFPTLSANEYYWVDLQGLDAFDTQGRALGLVADLIDNGAHSVLRIEFERDFKRAVGAKPGERMIPFVDAYVKSVDLPARRIVLDWDPTWDLDGADDEPEQSAENPAADTAADAED